MSKISVQTENSGNYERNDIYRSSSHNDIDNLFSEYYMGGSKARNILLRKDTTKNPLTPTHPTLHTKKTLTVEVPCIALKNSSDQDSMRKMSLSDHSALSSTNIRPNTARSGDTKIKSFGRQSTNDSRREDFELLRLAKDLQIPVQKIATLSTLREKEDFILDFVRNSVDKDLEELDRKHYLKSKKSEKTTEKLKTKAQADQKDIFEWLKIPTKFKSLKKKLRLKVVAAVNQNVDHVKTKQILNSMAEATDTGESLQMIDINNIPMIDNFELLSGLFEEESAKYLTMTRKLKTTQQKSTQFVNNTKKSETNSRLSVNPILSPTNEICRKTVLNEDCEEYGWNTDVESNFAASRADAKNRLSKETKNPRWNELGFSPLIQSFIILEKSKSERDAMLNKYMNGDLLLGEDYKLLADTSASLNSFVDKRYLQGVVNHLDSEAIEALELDLAEKILKDYQNVRQTIRQARQEYLEDKNEKCMERVEKMNERFDKNRNIELNREEQRRTKKRIVKFLKRIEDKSKWLSDNKVSENAKADIKSFVKNMISAIRQNSDVSKVRKNAVRGLAYRNDKSELFDIKTSQHIYHPSSKLLITKKSTQREEHTKHWTRSTSQSCKRENREQIEKFKLNIHCPQNFKDKRKFKNFYSGGPALENDKDCLLFAGTAEPKLNKRQLSSIIKLQAAWRGHKQRRIFKEMMIKAKEKAKFSKKLNDLKQNSNSKLIRIVLEAKHKDSQHVKTKQVNQIKISAKNGFEEDKSSPFRSPTSQGSLRTSPQRSKMMDSPNVDSRLKTFSIAVEKIRSLTPRVKIETMDTEVSIPNFERTINTSRARIQKDHTLNSAQAKIETLEQKRFEHITQRVAPKGLLLKQRKLFVAAKSNNLDVITNSGYYFSYQDVNTKDDENNTPLYYSAKNGNKEISEVLIKHGAQINDRCSNGNTPLHMAFLTNQVMLAILFLAQGGDLNILNNYGQTPVAFGSETILKLLGLENAIATYEKKEDINRLPQGYDNNCFMIKYRQNNQNEDSLLFRYQPLKEYSFKVKDECNKLNTFREKGIV